MYAEFRGEAADILLEEVNVAAFDSRRAFLEFPEDRYQQLLRIYGNLLSDLQLLGLLATMYDSRTNLSRQVNADIRDHFGDLVFETMISRAVKLGEAPSYGQPIILYDINSLASNQYIKFTKEVMERLERKTSPFSHQLENSEKAAKNNLRNQEVND